MGLGLGKAKARRLYQCLAHWRGRSLRAMWGIWRFSVQETTQNLLRAEVHWVSSHRSVTWLHSLCIGFLCVLMLHLADAKDGHWIAACIALPRTSSMRMPLQQGTRSLQQKCCIAKKLS